MSTLPITRYLDDLDSVVSGDGTFVPNSENTSVVCTSGATTGRSYLRKTLPVTQGDLLTFRFSARRISGTPQASVDYPSAGSSKSIVTIDSDEWMEYEIQYAIPQTHNASTDIAQCTVGTFTTPAGSSEVANIRISLDGGSRGNPRVWCIGLIALTKAGGVTTAALNKNFHHSGILNLAFSGDILKVTTLPTVTTGNLALRPIFDVSLTDDVLPDLMVKAGSYVPSTGVVDVKFSNGTGSFVGINSLLSNGEIAYVFIKATGI